MIAEGLAREQYDSLPDTPEPAEQGNPVRGHDKVLKHLAEAYRSGILPHAIILAGPRGIGKATLGFQFARYLLTYPDRASAPPMIGPPDTSSPVFRQVASGAHSGVLHLTRPYDEKTKKFRTAITVEDVRSIGRYVSMTAHDGGYRVVIIDAADDMNRNAANALLKNLEEPPQKTVFVLLSHVPGRLLPTIRSRCQMLRLSPLGREDLLSVLETMSGAGSWDAGMQDDIAKRSEGSVRNAILLTQFGGLEIATAVENVITGANFDTAEAHRIADAVTARGQEVQFDLFNSALLALIAGKARDAAGRNEIKAAAFWSERWHQTNETIAQTAAYNLDRRQHVVSGLGDTHSGFHRGTG